MKGDIKGVRIIPPTVEFPDVEVDVVHHVNIVVKNISKASKAIRFYGPQTKKFTLNVENPEVPVAAGLEVSAIVQYVTSEDVEAKDRLVLTVDGEVIEIPLIARPCQPSFEVTGIVNFGSVTATGKVISREVSIINHGSKAGNFKIKYTGEKPISIIPNSGTVPAKTAQIIKVEYVTKDVGQFEEEARVVFENNNEGIPMYITGDVVQRQLELLSFNLDHPVKIISFGNAYYGTDKTEMAILYNNSPEPVKFVAVLQDTAEGQEVGSDLTKTTLAILADNGENDDLEKGSTNGLTSLVAAIPNQGSLGAYEKIPIFFRFSPRWNSSSVGWKSDDQPPPRQDFALYMMLQIIGTGKLQSSPTNLEIALIGTALPVHLKLAPALKYNFDQCLVGEHVDSLCTVTNQSDELPVLFEFRRVAHFTAKPTKGRIKPGETIELMFSFAPNQVGSFKSIQMMDVIGQVGDEVNPLRAYLEVIHTQPIAFIGKSDPVPVKRQPKFNPGITPAISNEVGMFINTVFNNAEKIPRAAMLNSLETNLHKTQSAKTFSRTVKVAFPNDRAQSVRPSNTKEPYKTIFTGMDRHTYIDPDYAYTDKEAAKVKAHRDYYVQYINNLRENRKNSGQQREFSATNNKLDIGIKNAAGIKPKKLHLEEIKPDQFANTPPNSRYQVLSSKKLQEMERNASTKPVKEGLNAVPVTPEEKGDCSQILSPQQLHHISIGPQKMEFGQVCLRSLSTKELNIINNLPQYVHVIVDVDCRELRQTSPLSQVVPPYSKAVLPLIFESNTKGVFERSVTYTINNMYKSHVSVSAEVVPVALEVDKTHLEVCPSPGQPADAGFRGIVTLKNKLNYPAEFTWNPILGHRGTAFSIRPANGTVEPDCDLDCEVVFHPSYLAPEDGEFTCQVHGGNNLYLSCLAKFGSTSAQFIDRRIMFGQVPLHLTTTKSALLQNTSQNHGFFEVIDPNPFPGLTISPVHGLIPVGGTAELKASLTPDALMKFDTRIQISIRGWKTVELRMGGTVEPPCVDIDLKSITFGGVYCGSNKVIHFFLINRTGTKTRAMFDLSRYTDFTLSFPGRQTPEDYTFSLMNPGCYTITLEEGEEVPCQLLFKPTEVASYDFIMPVTINETAAPSPSPTPFPPTPAPSNKNSIQHIINPRPIHFSIPTPRRKVIATALRQPLEVSHERLEFFLPTNYKDMIVHKDGLQSKCTVIVNNSDKRLNWCIDLSKANKALEMGIFQFCQGSGVPYETFGAGGVCGSLAPGETFRVFVAFCPEEPGVFTCEVPFCINNEFCNPYKMLELYGELKAPKMWFDPLAIVLTPVPLKTSVSAEFHILAANYRKTSEIEIVYPEVECDDGSKISPLTVSLVNGNVIQPCCGDEGQVEPCLIPCRLTFSSHKPVSFTKMLKFVDSEGNHASIYVTATSDNCLLTCYPFIAQHRNDHHIICEQGLTLKGRKTESTESVNAGEAVFVPCASPPRPGSRPSTSATSTEFQTSSSSYESSHSVTESNYPSTPREGALIKILSISDRNSNIRQDITSRSLGSALFPDEDSEEGIFHTEVMFAAQRWFSAHGWPTGPNPIIIPNALRNGISKSGNDKGAAKKSKSSISNGSSSAAGNTEGGKKEVKTIYDMIGHLLGKPVPGIPINSPLPTHPIERAKQVYWQHATLLTFLKSQGACVASIKPEYLMELEDYKQWLTFQKSLEDEKNKDGILEQKVLTVEEESIEDQLFEAVSKRAWTDILLQILKTLVFSKVSPRQFKSIPLPDRSMSVSSINADPLCSNIYSVSERILLTWLNHIYEHFRENIWERCEKGGVPPSRWIVNFDYDLLDGLVLASILGSHCPFLIKSHLQDMYTHPNTAEQCLHNALKVVNALRHIGIEYDIQGIDITDPNPIGLMLLVAHLYQRMPQYLAKNTIEFAGALHASCMRQVRLSNPSNKPLIYHAMIAGQDAHDFRIPKGHEITIPPRGTQYLSVEFTSRFLRPEEAVLLLAGRRIGSAIGSTLVFSMKSGIDSITPKHTLKCESHCYELQSIAVEVTNPFTQGGVFRIVLVEAKDNNFNDPSRPQNLMKPREKKTKKVVSRTDHGQKKKTEDDVSLPHSPPSNRSVQESLLMIKSASDDMPLMNAYSCPVTSIDIEPNGTGTLEVQFLSFQPGKRQCSIIFINEDIGEFLYSIEANALLPLPSAIPFKSSSNTSVRISSAAAAGSGHGQFGGDDRVVYWKCEVNENLKEMLHIPITNVKREKALLIAAQQLMTEKERERRLIAGTLNSCTLAAKTVSLLSNNPNKAIAMAKAKDPNGTRFKVEVDNDLFLVEPEIIIPNLQKRQQKHIKLVSDDWDTVELPVRFCSKKPGHYTCKVTLIATDDVRVHCIECTVVPEGSTAELEFTSPVHQSVTQDIPIINHTNYDWNLEAHIKGPGFFGPPSLIVKACQTINYQLMFKPLYEKNIQGHLRLVNTVDGTEHVFTLSGKATKPLALDHIQLHCIAKQQIKHRLQIPNVTRKKLHYHVETDLPMVSGNLVATVWPGRTLDYDLIITPLQRGTHKGVVSFVAGKNPVVEVDSDGDEIPYSDDDNTKDHYRVWFTVDLVIEPPEPERVIEISCACQKKALLSVGVNNPSNQVINLSATIDGRDLSGPSEIKLEPDSRGTYELTFSPAIIGKTNGSLIFFHELTGEFWYELVLTAENPVPTTLSHMECELGRWDRQQITLDNPTDETLELLPYVSNTNNFQLERDNERPLVLQPHSSINIPLVFMPSYLGPDGHQTEVIFHSEKLGEWVFYSSGSGLMPQPQDPVCVYAAVGSNMTLIIPFRNPTDEAVLVDVLLKDKEQQYDKIFNGKEREDSAFCMLLKSVSSVRVGPKSTLDIPISFAPDAMTLYEALCVLNVRKYDGSQWKYMPIYDKRAEPGAVNKDIAVLKWLYPIQGIPEAQPIQEKPAVVECQARCRNEERLEVVLSGVAPCAAGGQRGIRARAVTPKKDAPNTPDGVVVAESISVTEEFTYQFVFDEESDANIRNAVALSLVRKQRDKISGLVVLIFHVVFAPNKTMKHDVKLIVKAATGGVWRFPVRFIATEPKPDDVITIEAVGLNKECGVGFRLTSQERYPVPYTAFFVAGSDHELSVAPLSGELLPVGTNGTLIAVSFIPTMYGKVYSGRLVVQTADMQWTYFVNGIPPEYIPPTAESKPPMKGPHPDPRKREDRVNYIRENIKLITTAVSSPIKGAPQLGRSLCPEY